MIISRLPVWTTSFGTSSPLDLLGEITAYLVSLSAYALWFGQLVSLTSSGIGTRFTLVVCFTSERGEVWVVCFLPQGAFCVFSFL